MRQMKTQISDINNASIIILDAGDFLKIKVDKVENKVIELIRTGSETNRDMTEDVINEELNYSIGDMVVNTPYTLGMVAAKLLKGTANGKCKKVLNVFDEIILQY